MPVSLITLKEVTKLLIQIYGDQGHDWMNYYLDKNNPYTFHHIKKKSQGGGYTLDNGALLTRLAHSYLHTIEQYDNETYLKLNLIFKRINESGQPPTVKQLKQIEFILKGFELKHKKIKYMSVYRKAKHFKKK